MTATHFDKESAEITQNDDKGAKPKNIRVLIAEDSPIFSDVLITAIEAEEGLHVVGHAQTGAEAVELTASLRPDIITMDVQMPVMDGLEATEIIMATTPTPILVVSGQSNTKTANAKDGALCFEALARGALDVISKPSSWPIPIDEQQTLMEKIKLLATIPVVHHVQGRAKATLPLPEKISNKEKEKLVAIVSSTGGPTALAKILSGLPADYPLGIVVVQHLADGFTEHFSSWLSRQSSTHVRLAKEGDRPGQGEVLIAPNGFHLTFSSLGQVTLSELPKRGFHKPSGDIMLESVARVFGKESIGIILTGMGDDGAQGLLAMKKEGALTIAQDEKSSTIYGMPAAAYKKGAVGEVLHLNKIADALKAAALT